MKKVMFYSFVAMMLMMTNNSYAQKANTFTGGFSAPLGGNFDDFSTLEWTIDIGYNITDWMAVGAITDISAGMFNVGEANKTYYLTNTFGCGLGFNILKSSDGVFSIRAFSGATIGAGEWKYTYYSGGVYYGIGEVALRLQ